MNKRTAAGRPTAGTNPSGRGGVSSVVAGDAGITVSTVGGVATVGQLIAAEWTIANCRVYAIDGVNGNDANRGYADPTTSSVGDYAIACAAAGLVAKKTIAGLAAIFPRLGNGRKVEIIILGGGTVYAGTIGDVLNGVSGFADGCPFVRGTFTNATAGSVAFAGTTAEATYAGAQTATGMNAAGYNPTGAPTTSTIQLLKVGGAAPAFGAEPAVPLGWRVRFNSATATAALRNVCRQVCQVTGTDTILLQTALPAVPVAGDVCYLEMAGWVQGALTLQGAVQNGTASQGLTLISMLLTGALTTGGGLTLAMSFCGSSSWSHSGITTPGVAQARTHPVLGSITFGGGLRCETTATLTGGRPSLFGLVTATDTTINGSMSALSWGAGCAARQLGILNTVLSTGDSNQVNPHVGTTAAVGIPHTFGAGANSAGFYIDGSQFTIGAMNVIGAGGSPAVKLSGRCKLICKGGVLGGITGNTDVGMDFQNAGQSEVYIRAGAVPTVTGSGFGDIRLSSQALAAWSNTNFEELWDQAGNHIFQYATNGAAYHGAMSPSVYAGVVNNGAAINGYALVCIQSATSGQVKYAIADTIAHAAGLVGAMLAGAGNGAQCLYGGPGGYKVVLFDGGAITPGAVAYLSDTVAGAATVTVPAVSITKAKLRIGVIVDNGLPFNLGIVRMTPDNYPVLADGLP